MRNVKGEVYVKITRRLRNGMGEKTRTKVWNDVWIRAINQVLTQIKNQSSYQVMNQVKQNVKL